ncbi:MAG: ABC transporter permease [Desulfurococcales archaeon]|nr:ABC transporter permease [Desulfurococcales archaeon]
MAGASLLLAWRELKKWVGRRGVFISSLVTPLLWIALFGKSFNLQALFTPPQGAQLPPGMVEAFRRAIEERIVSLFGTTDYFTFVSTGMLVVFAVFQGMFAGVSVIFDKRLGYLERLMASPVPRSSIYLSKVIATVARVTILDAILLGVALAMGLKISGAGPIDFLVAWVYVVLLAAALAAGYATMSFYAEHQEAVFAASNLINLPLMFSSSALFPVKQMPHWLQVVAKWNPVTHAANLVRHHLIGAPVSDYWLSVAYLATVTAVLLGAGLYLSVRWMENR